MSNYESSNAGSGFLGGLFLILLVLKLWGTNIFGLFGYEFTTQISWWWVAMPIIIAIWAGLTRPCNQ